MRARGLVGLLGVVDADGVAAAVDDNAGTAVAGVVSFLVGRGPFMVTAPDDGLGWKGGRFVDLAGTVDSSFGCC